ncbi:hypothetical protein C8J56DRAFT_774219 [Mycena floridula]|nr:hypothetical protein C8J56DRAFT_774219 [Mycena floridula]
MEKPTRKKQKRIQENAEAGPSESRPKKTRVKGKLRDLLSMPLDVLFEIFGHLLPQDLLRLARINKDFRTVLMARSTISVWKSARLNADCPDPPEGMSEPAWADLAFDNHCHFCFAIGVRNVEWWNDKVKYLSSLVEFRYGDARRVPTAVLPAIPSRHSILAMDMSIVAQWKDLPTDEAKKEFVAERKVIVDKIKEHAARCEIWAEGRSQNRTSELENLRDARYKAIVARLRDLGWGPELDLAPVIAADYTQQHLLLSRQKQVNAPQRLTDKIWKNIEKPVIEFMSQIRVYRLRRERQSLINDRKTAAIAVLRTFKISQLPFTELMPGAADFCVLPPVKALIDQPSEIDPDFDTIIPFIPDLFATWREAKEQKLKDLIGGDEESDTNPNLELASFLFICQPCTPRRALSFLNLFSASANSNPTVWFPEALSHHCCSLAASLPWTGRESTDVAANLTTQHRKRREWTPTYHKIDSSGHVGVKAIIEAAGLDPETATVDDMDQLDIYFACTTCESDFSSRPKIVARGWRKAVCCFLAIFSF